MLRRRWITVALTLAAGTTLGLAIPHLGAVAQSSPPSSPPVAMVHVDGATLIAKGAAVSVTVSVTCPVNAEGAFLSAEVVQRNGNGVASGQAGAQNFACTGSTGAETIAVPANGARVFKKGAAFASASLSFCDFSMLPNPCTTVSDTRTIDITR